MLSPLNTFKPQIRFEDNFVKVLDTIVLWVGVICKCRVWVNHVLRQGQQFWLFVLDFVSIAQPQRRRQLSFGQGSISDILDIAHIGIDPRQMTHAMPFLFSSHVNIGTLTLSIQLKVPNDNETKSHSWFGHYFCSNLYGCAPRGPRGVKKSEFFLHIKLLRFCANIAPKRHKLRKIMGADPYRIYQGFSIF